MMGSAYLGTGGGGKLKVGWRNLKKALADNCEFKLMPVAEMDDDDYAAVPYEVGSLAPVTKKVEKKFKSLPRTPRLPTATAYSALSKHMGKNFTGVIAGEVGPENTAAALICASQLGIATLDADVVGRATPQIEQHSVLVSRGSVMPAAAATIFGDTVILEKIVAVDREEAIFRALAENNMYIGVADAPIPGKIAKKKNVLVQGSTSLCRRIGAAFYAAKAAGTNPIDAARDAGDGYTLFEGKIASWKWKNKNGFLMGTLDIVGSGKFKKRMFRIDYQNENLVGHIDGKVAATVPDLITVVKRKNGKPVGNPTFKKGLDVVILGFRCNPIWRTKAGLAVFGPRHFDFDIDYVPIEKLVSTNC